MARVKKDLSELRKAVENCEPAKRELATKLLNQLEFMEDLLKELKDAIKRDGAVIEGKNGNGFIVKSEHPASKAYSTLIGKFNAMSKTVCDMVLDDRKAESDELMDFLGGDKR